MKANELMIGDWVYDTENGRSFQVGKSLFEYCDDWDRIRPIPLISEMLEKNGFWEEGGGFARFFPNVGKFTTWKSRIENVQCTLLGTVELPFYYVHELQHALRLCGLNDFADNFKIEQI